ncbi:tyrosine-type recombinase/integrase [Paenibacillus sp. MMO-177]|uniref:tyrosine-type recombinase/integrase n=1 Tax=Paenibacillus sp. MMO-177 TaxID=3081289 RepID=UPI003019135D
MNKRQLDRDTLSELLSQGVISKAVYDELLGQHDEAEKIFEAGGLPVREVVKSFESYLKDEFSRNTAEGYSINVRNFLEFLYEVDNYSKIEGDTALKAVTRSDIERWFLRLASNGYTYSSIRRFKHSVKKFFEYVSTEMPGVPIPAIDDIPLPTVTEDGGGSADIDALRDEEVMEIAEHSANIRNKAIIQLMYEAGMRRQELIDCEKSHVDFDKCMVKIYDAHGNVDRIGYFSEKTLHLLKEYLTEWEYEVKQVNENRLQKSRETSKPYQPVEDSKYLFQTLRSPQISYSTIFKAIKDASFEYYLNKFVEEGQPEEEAKRLADEKSVKINTETLRHSRRAYLFSQGKTIEQVQAIMGDENRHVCRRYLKISQRMYPEKFM